MTYFPNPDDKTMQAEQIDFNRSCTDVFDNQKGFDLFNMLQKWRDRNFEAKPGMSSEHIVFLTGMRTGMNTMLAQIRNSILTYRHAEKENNIQLNLKPRE